MRVIIDLSSKVNIIIPAFVVKFDHSILSICIKAQKIDSYALKTYDIIKAEF